MASRSSTRFMIVLAAGLIIWWPSRRVRPRVRLRDAFIVVAAFWVECGVCGRGAPCSSPSIRRWISPLRPVSNRCPGSDQRCHGARRSRRAAKVHPLLPAADQLVPGDMGIVILAVALVRCSVSAACRCTRRDTGSRKTRSSRRHSRRRKRSGSSTSGSRPRARYRCGRGHECVRRDTATASPRGDGRISTHEARSHTRRGDDPADTHAVQYSAARRNFGCISCCSATQRAKLPATLGVSRLPVIVLSVSRVRDT